MKSVTSARQFKVRPLYLISIIVWLILFEIGLMLSTSQAPSQPDEPLYNASYVITKVQAYDPDAREPQGSVSVEYQGNGIWFTEITRNNKLVQTYYFYEDTGQFREKKVRDWRIRPPG